MRRERDSACAVRKTSACLASLPIDSCIITNPAAASCGRPRQAALPHRGRL
ncbi:MAG: hypothetical protein MZV70_41385 [Desulfobacterales bacterium]|nr:hypothetical protein [Desulfobacterales bacterium]